MKEKTMESLINPLAARPKSQPVTPQPVKLSKAAKRLSLPARIVGAVFSLLFLLLLEFALVKLIFAHA
jgi:hypothetical protein